VSYDSRDYCAMCGEAWDDCSKRFADICRDCPVPCDFPMAIIHPTKRQLDASQIETLCAIVLRHVQDATGWTQAEMGVALGWAQSKVSRRMNLRGVASADDLARVTRLQESIYG